MSFAIDLSEHGSDLKREYESVISSDPETTWAVFEYDGSSNALKSGHHGAGELDEFVEAFDDARIQYGLVRVEFNSINKIVLVGWVGENVSARQRLVFNAHMSAVAKQFPGHHIQITARSSDELTPEIILDRVNAAAGSKYAGSTKPAPATKPKYVQASEGANEDDWVEVAPVGEKELKSSSGNGYKSSVREELEQLRKKKTGSEPRSPEPKSPQRKAARAPEPEEESDEEPEEKVRGKRDDSPEAERDESLEEEPEPSRKSGISGLDSGTSYKPVGKIDLKKIREEGKNSKFADARIEKIESSYKPVGKVDLKAIREQARKEKQLKSQKEDSARDEPPKLASRSSDRDSGRDSDREQSSKSAESNAVKAGYGVSASKKVTGPRTVGGDEDDEPQFSSLADRMKAFQNSVSGAKPKNDVSSSRPARKSEPARRAEPARSEPARSVSSRDDKDEDEDEDEAPLSVAAQLAKARLSKTEEPEKIEPKREVPKRPEQDEESEPSEPKAVSTFAARFAKKEEPKAEPKKEEPKKEETIQKHAEESEEDEAPPAPRRTPARAAVDEDDKADDKADDESDLRAVATQDYDAGDDDEISLKESELVINIQKVDENWWIGENSEGAVGLFPKDYVRLENEPSSGSSAKSTNGKTASKAPEPAASEGKTAIAQYSYEAGDEDELSFEENEEITEVEFPSEDWWSGKNSKGDFGLFPSSYVTLQ